MILIAITEICHYFVYLLFFPFTVILDFNRMYLPKYLSLADSPPILIDTITQNSLFHLTFQLNFEHRLYVQLSCNPQTEETSQMMCAFYNISFCFTIVFPSSNTPRRVHTYVMSYIVNRSLPAPPSSLKSTL